MSIQDTLRHDVKALKAFNDINYNQIAEYLQVKQKSFYSWLKGDYNLSYQKEQALKNYILQNRKE